MESFYAKLPNSGLNFAVDVLGGFSFFFFSEEKSLQNPPKIPLQDSNLNLGVLQMPKCGKMPKMWQHRFHHWTRLTSLSFQTVLFKQSLVKTEVGLNAYEDSETPKRQCWWSWRRGDICPITLFSWEVPWQWDIGTRNVSKFILRILLSFRRLCELVVAQKRDTKTLQHNRGALHCGATKLHHQRQLWGVPLGCLWNQRSSTVILWMWQVVLKKKRDGEKKNDSFPEILSNLKFLKAHRSQSCMVCLSVVRTSKQDAIAPKNMPVKFSYHRSN